MREYLIDIGNSSTEQTGVCAYINTRSPKAALATFKELVGDSNYSQSRDVRFGEHGFMRVFVNFDLVTIANVSRCE